MTHQQNYGADRLAIYTFTKLFKLFHEATTLDMKGVPPEHLAELYFNRYPQEVDPVWLNPCVDKRHREIWNPGKKCSDFPSLLVVGPQKTGVLEGVKKCVGECQQVCGRVSAGV